MASPEQIERAAVTMCRQLRNDPVWVAKYYPSSWKVFQDKAKEILDAALTPSEDMATLVATLNKMIDAWEVLPGNRHYSPSDIQRWMLSDLKPAIDECRRVLDRPLPDLILI